MSRTCIFTDSTAQFPIPAFAGRKLVNIVPLTLTADGHRELPANKLRAFDFDQSAPRNFQTRLNSPSVKTFENYFIQASQSYDGIVGIFHAGSLSKTYQHASQAARNLEGKVNLEVIDAMTIATGLGLAVQTASAAAEEGGSVSEIAELIRALLPRIYSVFCIQGLSYMYHSGYLSISQAIVGEHLKMLPIYILEEGHLVPTQKARNNRHLVDLMHEFISEFYQLEHIGLIQGVPPFEVETRALRERLVPDFEHTEISEHIISPELATMIGPRTLAMFILQSE